MKNGIPKISVLIICYKQEELIKRAIDSLLAQKDYIYEICVSDDCSPDRTWEILQEYDNQYPGLFKLHRNEPNVGIFENIEYTWSMPTGDLVYRLAGDDECGDSFFERVIEFIGKKNIDYKKELFCIFSDHKCIYPNGDSFVYKNKNSICNIDRIKMYERGILYNRGTCFSINVLKKFIKVSKGRSYITENAMDCQMHVFSRTAYYIPIVGNVYHAAIGVSVSMNDKRRLEHEGTMVYAYEFLKGQGISFSKKELRLPDYNVAIKKFRHKKNIKSLARCIYTYIRCFDYECFFKGISVKATIFKILRRLPHSNPINW